MPHTRKQAKYLAIHACAIIATFKLDDFASESGKAICSFLENIGAEYIISQLNYCLDPTAIGYAAWLIGIFTVLGGGFFMFFDLD